MPTDIKLWRIREEGQEEKVVEIPASKLSELGLREEYLQDLILKYPEIIEEELTIIGKEIESIDILGINSEGRVVVIETKRDEPRDAVGQALDYASLVSEKDEEWLMDRAEENEVDLSEYKNVDLEDPVIYVVGTEPDEKIERMVRFLAKYELNINVIIVRFYKDENGELYLARTYLFTEETKKELSEAKRRWYHWDRESLLKEIARMYGENTQNNLAALLDKVEKSLVLYLDFGRGKSPSVMLKDKNTSKTLVSLGSNGNLTIYEDWIKEYKFKDKLGEQLVTNAGFTTFRLRKYGGYKAQIGQIDRNQLDVLVDALEKLVKEGEI